MRVCDDAGEEVPVVERLFEWLLFRFRWIFVIYFVLPLSVLYNAVLNFRNWLIFSIKSAPRSHNRKVAIIQKQIRRWIDEGRTQKLCTARPGWLSMSFRLPKYKKVCKLIGTDQLVDVLEIDKEKETVRVEPNVTIGQLMKHLIPLGYTLPVVPELEDLTIGGLINGCGLGSSSRKHGLFQHVCQSFDIVMADGSLVTAAKKGEGVENQALFYGLPWSHGALGFLVAATLKIIPCKQFVRLTYKPCSSAKALYKTLSDEAANRENEFVEAIQFSKTTGVVMCGAFSEGPAKNQKLNRIGRWYKPWFFTHVMKIGKAGEVVAEYIPLSDYYRRHSKSIFWEMQDVIPFGNWLLFRLLLGWATPPKVAMLKVSMPKALRRLYDRQHVSQHCLVPMSNVAETVDLVDSELDVYPVWLCPFVLPSTPGMLRQRTGRNVMYVDVGVCGNSPKTKHFCMKESTRRLEKFLRSVGGVQMLYADTHMDKSEFWEMFDSSLYEWLRVKYGCRNAFPDIYEKVCRAARE